MFDGHYREKEASVIPVPNIEYQVFEAMMRSIYTGDILSSVMTCSLQIRHSGKAAGLV